MTAIDAYEPPLDETFEMRMQRALEENPNLIVPFHADNDEIEDEFNLTIKKCRKPRASTTTAAAKKAPAPLLLEKQQVSSEQKPAERTPATSPNKKKQ